MTENTRRDFLKAAGVVAAASAIPTAVHAAGKESLRVGLIGCGGRGKGAAADCLRADKAVNLVAVGDVFEDKTKIAVGEFGNSKEFAGRVNIGDRAFSGLDAFQKVLATDIDLVILATPPGFRPTHLAAAVEAGKNIFCEKPVAVDGPGIRKVLSLVEEAKKKNLAVVAGTQRRHQKAYEEVYKRIADGAIGEIVGGRCAWNNNGIWFNKRKPNQTAAEYQLRNWYHFLYLCGDHIVEQHVHNLDVINWFTGKHPTRAVGMGGRMGGTEARPDGTAEEVGNIWDHFAVEYEYPGGVKIASYCRHYPGVGDVSEMVVGTKGTIKTADGGYYLMNDQEIYSVEQDKKKDQSPYVREHVALIESIRSGKPLNELENVANSTLTAILGRQAAYTGRNLSWKDMLGSKMTTMPEGFNLGMSSIEVPPVPVPGKTKFV